MYSINGLNNNQLVINPGGLSYIAGTSYLFNITVSYRSEDYFQLFQVKVTSSVYVPMVEIK